MPADAARVEAIFQAATEIPDAAARSNYLDEACAGDAALKARILSLLKAHDHPDSLLDQPVVASPDPALAATRAFDPSDETRTHLTSDESDDEPPSYLAPSSRPDSLGKIGQYEILEVLGKGGFGTVFRAFDDKLQRVVAVKVMAPSLATTSPARKRFLREARSTAAIRHENVVQVHDVHEQPLPHLVMEFIPGETLQQRIDRTGPLDVAEVVRIGRQIAGGLAAAHATGLIHRDIKPSNILVESGPAAGVKITDFGLARAADDASLTRSGVVAGTPMYMAPEQAKGESLDHRADLFSLGSVLYVMATGRPPFRATSTFAVLKRVAEDAPRPMREIIPETPDWLARIVGMLHAKDPSARYQSAREVVTTLRDCEEQLKSQGAVKDLAHIPIDAISPPRRRRFAFAGLATLLLAIVGLGAFAPWRNWFTAPADPKTARLIVEVREPGKVSLEIFNEGEQVVTRRNVESSQGKAFDDLLPFGRWSVVARYEGVTSPYREIFELGPEGKTIVVPAFAGPPASAAAEPARAIAPFTAEQAKVHQEAWAKHLGLPVEFSNSVGMKFLLIPPGEFTMGSASSEMDSARAASGFGDNQAIADAIASEGPEHRVILSEPFYLGVTEVTRRQFELVTGRKPPLVDQPEGMMGKETWPAAGLSWNDGADFCSRLSTRDGLAPNYRMSGQAVEMLPGEGYRLPREAQWEFACRAGTLTRFWFGNDPAFADGREWLDQKAKNGPHPVGELVGNPFGLFDMHGNVREWCQDGWNPEYYLAFKTRAAVDPLSKPVGPHEHMIRGGYWGSDSMVDSRAASRRHANPGLSSPNTGLRVTLAVGSARRLIAAQIAKAVPQSPLAQEDWTPLFNGKDLTGWNILPAGRTSWKVENGVLVGHGKPSHLFSERGNFANFHLRIEVRVRRSANAGAFGVYGRVPVADPGMIIVPHGERSLTRTPVTKLYSDAPAPASPPNYREHPQIVWGADLKGEKTNVDPVTADEWLTYELIQDGEHVNIKVPDKFRGSNSTIYSGAKSRSGHIALQLFDDGSVVEIRKIDIKEISPSLTVPARAVAPFDAAQAKSHQDAWAKSIGVPAEFADDFGHTFRLIPPGEFVMGTSEKMIETLISESFSDKKKWEWAYPRLRSESPDRKVRIESGFYTATHETTVRQFREFVKDTGYKTRAENDGGGWVFEGAQGKRQSDAVWNSEKYIVAEDAPVRYLTRDDANAYCRWLSKKTGREISLPTEEQWEFACRAGTSTAWSFGNDSIDAKRYAWVGDDPQTSLNRVGQLLPNPFGLFDIHGNVAEFAQNPDGKVYLRGGSFVMVSGLARSATRTPVSDMEPFRESGFRIVMTGDLKTATAKRESPTANAEGFTPLFNGKELAGWKAHPQPTQKNWKVENGILTGSGAASYLYSPAQYANFNLKSEFRVNEAGNGGIFLRSLFPKATEGSHPKGYEVQIIGPEAAPSNYQTGGLVNFTDAKGTRIDADTWYTLEIIAHGPNMSVMLNGLTISNVKDEKNAFVRGHIALQLGDAGTTVRFRKLEILQLPSDPPAGTAPDPDVVKALEAKIAAVESTLANVRASYKEMRVPRAAVIGAESAVIEAKIKLAEQWKRHDEVVKLAGEAVTKQEELRGMMDEQVKAGVLPKSTLDAIDSTIADAKLRLAKAKLNRPEKKP